MLQKIKKGVAILIILVLLPYIITIFINGKKVDNSKEDPRNLLVKKHCIGLLAKEVSSEYKDEMIKVQALLVRTTVYKEIEEKGEEILSEEGFGDVSHIDKSWYKKLEKIWEETEGEVILYEGKLALVPFHQLSNGKTRNGAEVLGTDDYPYLTMKECTADVEAPGQMESVFIDLKEAAEVVCDSAGYVLSVKIGDKEIGGETFRNTYQLKSSCFELQKFQDKTRVITQGVGHGVGLSQYTANDMAKKGKTYTEILQYFFEGTEIREVAEILWNIE